MRILQRPVDRILAYPARLLLGILSRQRPQQAWNGIHLIVADEARARHAGPFFERTAAALGLAASRAPLAFTEFRKDVEQVLLWDRVDEPTYNRFQFAVIAPPSIALEAEIDCYAAWLLHTSRSNDKRRDRLGLQEFLGSVDGERRPKAG